MFIFIRLLLAHFVGDFPLQFNKIYVLKHTGLAGGLPHSFLVISSLLAFSWPYLYLPKIWICIFFVGGIHLLQDSIKISYEKAQYAFLLYVFDQLFHVATIATVLLTDLSDLSAPASKGAVSVSP